MSLYRSVASSTKSESLCKCSSSSPESIKMVPKHRGPITAEQHEFKPTWRFYAAFGSLSIISLMVALDATSISVALSIMADLLHATAIEAFWAGTSFLLTSTVSQPVLGSFSDIFGRKAVIMVSLTFFTAGSIVAAIADNFTVILVGRSIQGIGGGGVIVMTQIVITDLVPMRQRGKWLSVISATWALGTVCGPLLGGGFSENVNWRWIFWVNLPFVGLGLPMIIFFLRLHFRTSSLMHKMLRIDWPGVIVFVAALTGLLVPVTWGGIMYDWTSWRTLVPLIVCAVALVCLIVYEDRYAIKPLIPTDVFKNRTAASAFAQTMLHGLVLWSELYYIPLYYEAVKGYSPILAGVALFPQTLTVAPAAVAVGFAITHTGRYRWALWAGWLLTTLGTGLLILLDVDTSVGHWIAINLVSGLGTGILFPATNIAIQSSAAPERQAAAVTMYGFLRTLGQTLGVAVGGVVFQNHIARKLRTLPGMSAAEADSLSRNASGLVEVIKAMPSGSARREQLRVAYVYGLRHVWIVMCALAAVAGVISCFAEGLPLDQALATEQGFKGDVTVVTDEEEQAEEHAQK